MAEVLKLSSTQKVWDTILDDIHEFYFGGYHTINIYLLEYKKTHIGPVKYQRPALRFWHGEPEPIKGFLENIQENVLSKVDLLRGFNLAQQDNALCCLTAMLEEGVGHGCAVDIDHVIQYSIFSEVRYG